MAFFLARFCRHGEFRGAGYRVMRCVEEREAGTERKAGTGQDWKGPYWQARRVKAVRGKIRTGELRSGRQAREAW